MEPSIIKSNNDIILPSISQLKEARKPLLRIRHKTNTSSFMSKHQLQALLKSNHDEIDKLAKHKSSVQFEEERMKQIVGHYKQFKSLKFFNTRNLKKGVTNFSKQHSFGTSNIKLEHVSTKKREEISHSEGKFDLNILEDNNRTINRINIIVVLLISVSLILVLYDNYNYNLNFSSFFKNLTTISKTEIETFKNNPEEENEIIIRTTNIAILFIIDIMTFWKYQLKLKNLQYFKYCTNQDNIITSGLIGNLVKEVLFLSIFYPPTKNYLMNYYVSNEFFFLTINSIFLLVCCFKLYVIIQAIYSLSQWRKDEQYSICMKYFGPPHDEFCLKATLKSNFVLTVGFLFLFLIIYFGIVLFIFDNMILFRKKDNFYTFDSKRLDISVGFWVIFETSSTLGYGDFFVISYLGRGVAIITAVLGFFFISMINLNARKKLEFTTEEKNSFIEIKKSLIRSETESEAILLIKSFINFRKILLNRKQKTFKFLFHDPDYDIYDFIMKELISKGRVIKKEQIQCASRVFYQIL